MTDLSPSGPPYFPAPIACPSLRSRVGFLAAPLLAAIVLSAGLLSVMSLAAPLAWADDDDLGLNTAGIIDYPTALDQRTANMVHGTLEVVDAAAPDLRPANLRYGRQISNVQLLADINWLPEPDREFDYAELKAKVRVMSFDPQRTYIALGALGRWTDQQSKQETQLDNKPYSLLAILTTELFPLDNWSGFLFNFYLDNRFFDTGLKVDLYPGIKFVSEADYHHGDVNDNPTKWRTKAGVEFDTDQTFYVQVLYDDQGNHVRLQFGSGF